MPKTPEDYKLVLTAYFLIVVGVIFFTSWFFGRL